MIDARLVKMRCVNNGVGAILERNNIYNFLSANALPHIKGIFKAAASEIIIPYHAAHHTEGSSFKRFGAFLFVYLAVGVYK